MRGDGFSFDAPRGWELERPRNAVVARHGDSVVSVTRFPLLKPYQQSRFDEAAKELDRVARELAERAGSSLSSSETTDVDGRKVRAYRYGDRRIGFVLEGRREYQLYCVRADAACDLLFSTFTLARPPS